VQVLMLESVCTDGGKTGWRALESARRLIAWWNGWRGPFLRAEMLSEYVPDAPASD
jgi:hypothetical protein